CGGKKACCYKFYSKHGNWFFLSWPSEDILVATARRERVNTGFRPGDTRRIFAFMPSASSSGQAKLTLFRSRLNRTEGHSCVRHTPCGGRGAISPRPDRIQRPTLHHPRRLAREGSASASGAASSGCSSFSGTC